MNNKGFTVIELVLSFAFVSALTVSLFALVINYRDKEKEVSDKSKVNDYSNVITSIVQKDIETKILKNVEYCVESGTTLNKCVELEFQDGTRKKLQVVFEVKNTSIYTSTFEYYKYYIVYDEVLYPVPSEGVVEVRVDNMLTKTSSTDSLENNLGIYKINIGFFYRDKNLGHDVNIVGIGDGTRETNAGSYRSYSVGQAVNVKLNNGTSSNVPFHVLKDSDSYTPYVLLLADNEYGSSPLYNDASSPKEFTYSNAYFRLSNLYSEWTNLSNRNDIRLVTASEISMLTNSGLSPIVYDAATTIYLGITGSSAASFLTSVSAFWTSSNYLTTNKLDSAWAYNGGNLVKTPMGTSLSIRPVIKINKSYILV